MLQKYSLHLTMASLPSVIVLLLILVTGCVQVYGTDTLSFVFRGEEYLNGSYIRLRDIGEVRENVLNCITTNVQCCGENFAAGEFYFPNGNRVPIRENARSNGMYRHRGHSQIDLGRIDGPSYTDEIKGLYRCEIPDSSGNGLNNTISINIVDQIPPMVLIDPIRPSGSNIAGQQFTLFCPVTLQPREGGQTAMPTFMWLDQNGVTIPSGRGDTRRVSTMMSTEFNYTWSSTLQFDPLLTSNGGRYTCKVSVLEGTETAMRSTEISVVIPMPTVLINVQSDNVVLHAGTSMTLTCTITVDDVVNTDVEVDVTWTPFSDRLTMLSTTGSQPSFTSNAMLDPLSLEDTEFTCNAVVRPIVGSNFIIASNPGINTKTITIEAEVFQVSLSGIASCVEWTSDDSLTKTTTIVSTLVQAVEHECQCGFTRFHITAGRFRCFPNSEHYVTFRAKLSGTPVVNISQLISYIEQWISSPQLITIQNVDLSINGSCDVAIMDFSAPECRDITTTRADIETTTSESDTNNSSGSTAGAVVVVLLFIALGGAALCAIVVYMFIVRKHPKIKKKRALPPIPSERNISYDVMNVHMQVEEDERIYERIKSQLYDVDEEAGAYPVLHQDHTNNQNAYGCSCQDQITKQEGSQEQPNSKRGGREQPNAKGESEEQPNSKGGNQEQLNNKEESQDQPNSKGGSQEQPNGKGESQEQPNGKGESQEQPNGKGESQENPSLVKLECNQNDRSIEKSQEQPKPPKRKGRNKKKLSKQVKGCEEQPMSLKGRQEQPKDVEHKAESQLQDMQNSQKSDQELPKNQKEDKEQPKPEESQVAVVKIQRQKIQESKEILTNKEKALVRESETTKVVKVASLRDRAKSCKASIAMGWNQNRKED